MTDKPRAGARIVFILSNLCSRRGDGKTQREDVVVSEESPAAIGHRRPRQVKRVSNVFLEKDSK